MLSNVEIKSLQPGDRVLIECEVRSKVGDPNSSLCDDGDVAIKVFWGGGEDFCFAKSELFHQVLPRQIAIGDTVRNSNDPSERIYEVISSPRRASNTNGEQVALWSQETGVASSYVCSLIRIRSA